jgi:hypothetical protein
VGDPDAHILRLELLRPAAHPEEKRRQFSGQRKRLRPACPCIGACFRARTRTQVTRTHAHAQACLRPRTRAQTSARACARTRQEPQPGRPAHVPVRAHWQPRPRSPSARARTGGHHVAEDPSGLYRHENVSLSQGRAGRARSVRATSKDKLEPLNPPKRRCDGSRAVRAVQLRSFEDALLPSHGVHMVRSCPLGVRSVHSSAVA